MPYTSKQRRFFHAAAERGEPGMEKLAHEADQYAKHGEEKPPVYKGAKHNHKEDMGDAGAAHEKPEQKTEGAGEHDEKPMKRGASSGKHSEGSGPAGKGASKYGKLGNDVPGGGDVSGNESEGEAAVTHLHDHVHHHDDTHIHIHAGSAGGDPVHMNPHSGFQRPPMSGGHVPMYSASQQGVTMNDSKPMGHGDNAFAARGAAATGKVGGKANPVRKGRG